MKKIFLSASVVLFVIVLSGCGHSSSSSPSSSLPTNTNSETSAENGQDTIQRLMRESLRIQKDETLTKEEKATAIEDVQRRIRELNE